MAESIPQRRSRHSGAARVRALPKAPEPPAHLDAIGAALWRQLAGGWQIHDDGLPLLQASCEQWQLYQRWLAQYAAEGPTVRNEKTGAVRPNPAGKAAENALTAFRQCLRQLGLEPPVQP